jgi:hypothetical protein
MYVDVAPGNILVPIFEVRTDTGLPSPKGIFLVQGVQVGVYQTALYRWALKNFPNLTSETIKAGPF